MDQPTSPGSRTRLVVASQALEIQHLQDMVKSRDREIAMMNEKAAAASGAHREEVEQLTAKNARLDSHVQLLASKLRELEEAKENKVGEDVSTIVSMTQVGHERDSLISQLREELRSVRNQNTSLVQEREIILEKLVGERGRISALEAQLGGRPGESSRVAEVLTTTRSCQTGGTSSVVPDELLEPGQPGIEVLRNHIELEQELVLYHQNMCAAHGANVAELNERLQRRLQLEVRKLQDAQEKYQKLMGDYGRSRSSTIAPPEVPAYGAPSEGLPASRLKTPSASISTTTGSSPFFRQQEEEMANLRKRLVDLQSRYADEQPPASSAAAPSFEDGNVSSGSSGVLSRMLHVATSKR